MLLTACGSDLEYTHADRQPQVPLQVATSITVDEQATTRAAGSQWEADDAIGIFATTAASGSSYTVLDNDLYHGTNAQYVFNDGSNLETYVSSTAYYRQFTSASPVFLPADFAAIHVYAYYPYSSTATNATQIPVNVATQTVQKNIDFMRASATATTQGGTTAITHDNPTCQLRFAHRLCKVQFNLVHGAGMTADAVANALSIVMTGQATSGTYNIFTDALTITSGTSGNITALPMATAATGYDKSFEAIILPNGVNNAAADRTLTITLGSATQSHTYTCTLPVNGTHGIASFAAGNKYTLNITVNATGLALSCAITPWTAETSVTGTATHLGRN